MSLPAARRARPRGRTWPLLLLGAACAGSPASKGRGPAAPLPPGQDLLEGTVHLDLDTLEGEGRFRVRPDPLTGEVGLAASGIELLSVTLDGAPQPPPAPGDDLRLRPASAADLVEIEAQWAFPERSLLTADGWMADARGGASLIWPHHCPRLFPCAPSPAEGARFALTAHSDHGVVLAPGELGAEAPAYQLGVARGDYTRLDLGQSDGGVDVFAWHLPARGAAARRGTGSLVAALSFLERTLGPYPYGSALHTVEVDWGRWSWGGIEHHPMVHVATFSFSDPEVQVHEAAHAWTGDHLRIACWEDLVLSEGTTTWLAARALAAADGTDLWPRYVDEFLVPLCADPELDTVTLPDQTCGQIDLTTHPLGGGAPYFKGACFFEEVGDLLGPARLEAAVGRFVQARGGGAARMQDLIDHLADEATPAERPGLDAAVQDWLRAPRCPADAAARCRSGLR